MAKASPARPQAHGYGSRDGKLDGLLRRPSFSKVPHTGVVRESDVMTREAYHALMRNRKVFRGKPFTATPYVSYDGKLREKDQLSFCAAGYFLWRPAGGKREGEVLMAWEDREDKRLLNFIGGRRDSVDETACAVAARETVSEETAGLLSPATREVLSNPVGKTVVWMPNSKYALLLQELTEKTDQDIHERFALLPKGPKGGPLFEDPTIVALAWVPGSDLLRSLPQNFAPFTRSMISILKSTSILPDLWASCEVK